MTLRSIGILLILFFTIVSISLSMTANMQGLELGALFNLAVPPLTGAVSLIIYLLVCWRTTDRTVRIFVIAASCVTLLLMGFKFHLASAHA